MSKRKGQNQQEQQQEVDEKEETEWQKRREEEKRRQQKEHDAYQREKYGVVTYERHSEDDPRVRGCTCRDRSPMDTR